MTAIVNKSMPEGHFLLFRWLEWLLPLPWPFFLPAPFSPTAGLDFDDDESDFAFFAPFFAYKQTNNLKNWPTIECHAYTERHAKMCMITTELKIPTATGWHRWIHKNVYIKICFHTVFPKLKNLNCNYEKLSTKLTHQTYWVCFKAVNW